MTSIIHLYGALGALNTGLRSRTLCTGVTCTKSNLRLVEALYKFGLISHYHFPTDIYIKRQLNKLKKVRASTPKSIHMLERRIIVFFRWGFFDKGVELKVRSTPGHRRYLTHDRLCTLLLNSNEMFFLSTSIGILNAHEAFNLNIGGELLFSIRY